MTQTEDAVTFAASLLSFVFGGTVRAWQAYLMDEAAAESDRIAAAMVAKWGVKTPGIKQ